MHKALNFLLQNVDNLIFIVTKNCRVTAVSNGVLDFYKCSRSEIINKNCLEFFRNKKYFFPFSKKELLVAVTQKVVAIAHSSAHGQSDGNAGHDNHGYSSTIEWVAQPLQQGSAKPKCDGYILLTGKDVAAEQSKAQNYLTSIIDCIPGCLYCKDLHGRYLWCNQFMLETLELASLGAIIGKTDFDIWPESAPALQQNDRYIIGRGKTVFLEEMVVTHNDKTSYFTGIKMPLRNEDNKIVGIIGNVIDISNLKQTEAALRSAKEKAEQASAASREKNKFISNMEHDLRTPCVGVLQVANLMQTEEVKPALKKKLHYIAQASRQLLELLDDVLYFSRIQSGEQPVVFEKLNIRDIANNIVALEAPVVQKKGIKLLARCDKNIPAALLSDKHRVQRILINLVGNAIKFTEKGSVKINVRLAKRISNKNIILRISVKDTGIGIPKNKQKIIYERFFRIIPSDPDKYKGSGLGLSIVKQFVSELEGEIKVKSQRGKGTEFICDLPLQVIARKGAMHGETTDIGNNSNELNCVTPIAVKPNIYERFAQQKLKLKCAKYKQKNLKILLVEDNKLIKYVTKALLINFAHKVDVATTGARAIALARKNKYDLIFVDIGLPDISGYKVTKNIRTFNATIPIVALTAYAASVVKHRGAACGINDFLTKPLNNEKIEYVIDKWIVKKAPVKKIGKTIVVVKNRETEMKTKAKVKLGDGRNNKIIDLKLGAQFVSNDQKKALSTIEMMINNFSKVKNGLENSYKNKNWKMLGNLTHQMRGGITYCGTPQLQTAIVRLDEYLASKRHKRVETVTRLYENFLHEIELVSIALQKIAGAILPAASARPEGREAG